MYGLFVGRMVWLYLICPAPEIKILKRGLYNYKLQISALFRGVAVLVDGHTDPSADEIKQIMSQHGGKFHMYYSRKHTTHVIASNLPRSKIKELRPDQNVVSPNWITDSIKANDLLPLKNYRIHFSSLSNQKSVKTMLTSHAGTSKSNEELDTDIKNDSLITLKDVNDESIKTEANKSSTSMNSEDLNTSTSKTSRRSSGFAATSDSNFLSEFYSNSRLHFLSTWKNKLVAYVRTLQSENKNPYDLEGYQKLMKIASESANFEHKEHTKNGKYLMHIDMDCFFASVALLTHPHLEGKPIAVTHSSGSNTGTNRPGVDFDYEKKYYENLYNKSATPNTGVPEKFEKVTNSEPAFSAAEIACCNYEARKFGLRNGMFFGKAKVMCPDLQVVPYDFDAYKRVSEKLYSLLTSYTYKLEAVSCDEALVDITDLVKNTRLSPFQIAAEIRKSVKEETGCNCSAGIGPNIALARMATRVGKPNGQYEIEENQASEFMKEQLVKDLPGVGRATAYRLQELGITKCKDLQNLSQDVLQSEFGTKSGEKLKNMSMGIDDRQITLVKERKSVSAEVNYGIRLSNEDETKTFFHNLSNEVTKRLLEAEMIGRKITLKLKVRRPDAPVESVKFKGHGVCNNLSKSATITQKMTDANSIEEAVYQEAWKLLKSLKISNVSDLRGIGIQITQLTSMNASNDKISNAAAFMEKFLKNVNTPSTSSATKPSIKTETSSTESSVIEVVDEQVPNVPTVKERQGKTEDEMNASFLDALPPDIRKEVEENMERQKRILNIMDTEVKSVPPNINNQTASISSTNRSTQSKNKENPAKRKRKNVKSSSKKGIKKQSPNKLITDMFPVAHSPKKHKVTSLSHNFKRTILTESKPTTSILIQDDTDNLATPIVIDTDSRESMDSVNTMQTEQVKHQDCPSLGGATAIQEIRGLLNEWVSTYLETGPLETDVNDIVSFLTDVLNNHDLEKVYLVLKYLQRLVKQINDKAIKGEITKPVSAQWVKSYEEIVTFIQTKVSELYRGGRLKLGAIFL